MSVNDKNRKICPVLHLSGQRDATRKKATTSWKKGCLFRTRLAGFSGMYFSISDRKRSSLVSPGNK